MAEIGVATVSTVVGEVCEAIVKNMWAISVDRHFPEGELQLKEKMLDMDKIWQFARLLVGCRWLSYPNEMSCGGGGGGGASKEYHNFKNFYSIVLMGMVDSKYRFIWASCGYPGKCHDSIIIQSTFLGEKLKQGDTIRQIAKSVDGVDVPPLILGDSAFPFQSWLMKHYTNAALTPKRKYFNYRLCRARMVTEGAYGQLKRRWRVLLRKCESSQQYCRTVTLACTVLHNVCIDQGETVSRQLDLTYEHGTGERRDRATIKNLPQMNQCAPLRDSCQQAYIILNCLAEKLWREKDGHGVH